MVSNKLRCDEPMESSLADDGCAHLDGLHCTHADFIGGIIAWVGGAARSRERTLLGDSDARGSVT
jgi:hypothetical protein